MILNLLIGKVYKPILVRYLKKPRKYYYKGINLIVYPGVFHPAFFFSTKYLLRYLSTQSLKQKSLLELGAGSGLIAMFAAKQGATVTASDISKLVIEKLNDNVKQNQLPITTIHSDLFRQIPIQIFDYIIINPPYYKRNPKTEDEQAWYCGEEMQYFQQLFTQINEYIHPNNNVLMVLSEVCDIESIKQIANKNGITLQEIQREKIWREWNFIYKINLLH